jgi:hypothetical protein
MQPPITKAAFLAFGKCATRAWQQQRAAPAARSAAEDLRIHEGTELGELARAAFPGGVLVQELDTKNAVEITKALMDDPNVHVIFEGAFTHDSYVTRPDVLVREGDGWRLIEVKSSLHDEKGADKRHILDLAYTTMVLRLAGITPTTIELMRLSRDWTGDSTAPFRRYECTREVLEHVETFLSKSHVVSSLLGSTEMPTPELTLSCRGCDLFGEACIGAELKHPVLEIPRLSEKGLSLLKARGIIDIRDIPADFDLTSQQRFVVDYIQGGQLAVDAPKLRSLLSKITWPCHYLDFESVKSAIPLWPGTRPHQQILTQYSLHMCDDLEGEPRHVEYLAPHTHDARRELAERLISDLGDRGSIIVYSKYEATQVKALGELFPDLAEDLSALRKRFFDLEEVFKGAVAHPEFRGSTSIKKVLPVLVPELSYEGLGIGNGEAAIVAFAKMARGLSEPQEVENLRRQLLAYCKHDTLAMVALHRAVASLLSTL